MIFWGITTIRPASGFVFPRNVYQHAVGGGSRRCRARDRPCHSARQSLCAAEGPDGHCAGDDDRFADAAVRHLLAAFFSTSRGLITLGIYCYLVLLVFPAHHPAGGIRRFAPGEDHSAADGDHPARLGERPA